MFDGITDQDSLHERLACQNFFAELRWTAEGIFLRYLKAYSVKRRAGFKTLLFAKPLGLGCTKRSAEVVTSRRLKRYFSSSPWNEENKNHVFYSPKETFHRTRRKRIKRINKAPKGSCQAKETPQNDLSSKRRTQVDKFSKLIRVLLEATQGLWR
ncbi:hypothetical protein CEXT_694731 [Caerostris extrusa]|uniref:Uncharacterized protein n=1 Tax=Caerostris extrusa TaxID=172846 RepID=A0AAV4QG60_CAEEX|nr:hypothetical protein CEXT_694731 [Caerostris extrusa]